MMKKHIDELRNEQGNFLVSKDFKARFHKFIVENYLRKFHCFYLHLTHLDTFFICIQPTKQNPRQVGIECLGWIYFTLKLDAKRGDKGDFVRN